MMLDHTALARLKILGAKALRGALTDKEKKIMNDSAKVAWELVSRKEVATPFSYTVWFYTALYTKVKGIQPEPEEFGTIAAYIAKWIANNSNIFCDPELLYNAAVDMLEGVDNTLQDFATTVDSYNQVLSSMENTAKSNPEVHDVVTTLLKENLELLNRLEEMQQELSKMKKLVKTFKEQVEMDALTQVVNRRGFDEKIKLAVNTVKNSNLPSCVIMVDVDHFKRVNDTYGHQAGDAVLYQVAQILKNSVRNIDTVARYGGEEFAVILKNTTLDDARSIAERMRKAIERSHVSFDGRIIKVTASFGIAQVKQGDTPQSVIQRADEALYAAKKTGRNRVVTEEELPEVKKALEEKESVKKLEVEIKEKPEAKPTAAPKRTRKARPAM